MTAVRNPEQRHPADPALRPERLDDFLGQDDHRANLRIYLDGARDRGDPLDHALLSGPPGLGKTSLARIIARELGSSITVTSGPALVRPGDLAAILSALQPRDVLFIDEIHRLSAIVEETLYPAMEDYRIDVVIGRGPSAQTLRLDLAPFTLIAATTRAGALSHPLRERFGILLRFRYYPPDALAEIVTRGAARLDLAVDPDAAMALGRAARGTPRLALRLLRRVRDFAAALPVVTTADVGLTLERLAIDADGLDDLDRRYLRTLTARHGGGPAGLETLAAAIGEPADTLQDTVEPYLIQQGFIERTAQGRIANGTAWARFPDLAPMRPTDQPVLTGLDSDA